MRLVDTVVIMTMVVMAVGVMRIRSVMLDVAEEFIEGRELYVGMLGNSRLQAFPVRE